MISFGSISLDLIIIVVIILILGFLTFKLGKKFLFSLILAFYPALVLYNNLPFISTDSNTAETVAFLAIYVFGFFIFFRNLHPRNSHNNFAKLFEYGVLIVAFLILLSSIGSHKIANLTKFINFSGLIDSWLSNLSFGLALLIPLIVILFTTKKDIY